jgi:hypothetical protein
LGGYETEHALSIGVVFCRFYRSAEREMPGQPQFPAKKIPGKKNQVFRFQLSANE